MFNRIRLIIVILAVLLTGVFGIYAQDVGQPFAAVQDGNLTLFGLGDAPVVVDNPPNKGIISTAWSPDGSKLAYTLYDEQYQTRLFFTDASGTATLLETGLLEAGFPITFTPEGNILYVGQGVFPTDNSPYMVDVKQIAPEAGAQPQTLHTFSFASGCGGGSTIPADWQYWNEAGFGGNGLILSVTPYGLLHSNTCGGSGLALLNLETGEDKPVGDTVIPASVNDFPSNQSLVRAVVAPDGKTVAALRPNTTESTITYSLVLIDLEAGTVTDVTTAEEPDQLAWGNDGTLFYSTQTERADLSITIPETGQEAFQVAYGMEATSIPAYGVSIHQLDPASGNDSVIYTADAYLIGRMRVTADGSTLVFTQIPNLNAWVEAISSGELNPVDDISGELQRSTVPVTLYRLPLGAEASAEAVTEAAQVDLSPA